MTVSTESIHNQLQQFFETRKNIYVILYSLLSEPLNEELLFEMRNFGNFQELKTFHEGGQILDLFFAKMTRKQIKQEREEYSRLFVGPGSLIAPPWESYYRSKEHLLFEDSTFRLRELYHQFGLKFIRENNEPDDHVLLELEFMIHLIDLCLQPAENTRVEELISSQLQLLEEHLAIWIPDFCERIVEHTKSQLYLGTAMLLEDFITFDLASLLELKEAFSNV